jgi:hypothetical protein
MGDDINCYYWSISNLDNFMHGEDFEYSQVILLHCIGKPVIFVINDLAL